MFCVDHLNTLRKAEIDAFVRHFHEGAHVLEIGAGTGQQALDLTARGFHVAAIEITASAYSQSRLFPVVDYDGSHIPFEDGTFDIVFSSNVLEHVLDLPRMYAEIRRVLKPGGYCIHVLPTHAWRFWTSLAAVPAAFQYAATLRAQILPRPSATRSELRRVAGAWVRAAAHLGAPLLQRRHGERGNIVSELWLFHPSWWRRSFQENGFEVVHDEPMGLFYTGHMVLGSSWSLEKRARFARRLGSACHLFKVRPVH